MNIGNKRCNLQHMAVLLGLFLLTGEALAARPARVALFPLISAPGIDIRIKTELQRVLDEASKTAHRVEVLWGVDLAAKLNKDPAKTVAQCEKRRRFAVCFGSVAEKLGADELLLARIAPDGAGNIRLVVLAIRPPKSVEARASVEFAKGEPIESVFGLKAALFVLGAETAQPNEAIVAHQDEESPAPKTEPSEPVQTAAPSVDPPSDPFAFTPKPANRKIVAANLQTKVPPATVSNPWLFWGGIAATVVGFGLLGAGGYFGYDALEKQRSVESGEGMTQVEAVATEKAANQAAGIANIFFVAGGLVATTGATLVGVDLLW